MRPSAHPCPVYDHIVILYTASPTCRPLTGGHSWSPDHVRGQYYAAFVFTRFHAPSRTSMHRDYTGHVRGSSAYRCADKECLNAVYYCYQQPFVSHKPAIHIPCVSGSANVATTRVMRPTEIRDSKKKLAEIPFPRRLERAVETLTQKNSAVRRSEHRNRLTANGSPILDTRLCRRSFQRSYDL